jgi:hypothetical protein
MAILIVSVYAQQDRSLTQLPKRMLDALLRMILWAT